MKGFSLSGLFHRSTLVGVIFFIGGVLGSGRAIAAGTSEDVFRTGAPAIMDLDAGILVGDGVALPGVDMQIVGRLATETRIYAGVDLGLFIYSGDYSSAAVIPLLGTIFAEFDTSRGVHPTIGISAGPTLSTGDAFSTARFTAFINPGARFDLGNRIELNGLVRLGVLGSDFVVLPQVGVTFAI